MLFKLFLSLFVLNISFAQELNKEYDYIVVGGGTAGCVVAARLAHNMKSKVLLVEAGGVPPWLTKIVPFYTSFYLFGYGFNYFAEPEDVGNVINSYWPRGKMLGGTSTLNGALFVRANKNNFADWVNIEGAEGWTWDDVLPFYKKIEHIHYEEDKNTLFYGKYHSTKGKIPIDVSGKNDSLLQKFIHRFENYTGFSYMEPNNGVQIGVSLTPMNIYDRTRRTSYTEYLKPVMDAHQSNLVVETNAFVEKIVFTKKRATSVIYKKGKNEITVNVKKEVILCAGVINSPQLLMLSGVGPENHLKSLNIPVVQNLPVGQNLKDHFGVMKSLAFNGIGVKLDDPLRYDSANAFYGSYIHSDMRFANPDIQLMIFAYSNYYVSITVLSKPKSKGYIELKSTNPYDHPKIVANHLTQNIDVERLACGTKKASEIFQFMDLSPISSSKCSGDKHTKEYWQCVVKAEGGTFYHPVGTCKMGGSNRSDSVVDSRLKVIGLDNVRVADASIFPDQISGNPVATILMIGERVVEFIKKDEKLSVTT